MKSRSTHLFNQPNSPPNLQLSSRRELLVIDDQQIRQKYFSDAHGVLKKLEAAEERILQFQSTDQRLFDQWYKLTFREDQEALERSREDLRRMSRFHNWVVATAIKLQIEMPQAYVLMKEVERQWLAGSPKIRAQIDLDREARDRYASAQIHGRYNESYQFDSEKDQETEISAQLGQILSHLEMMLFQTDFESDPDFQSRIERILDLPDEDLIYRLKEQDAAFLLFEVSLTWSEHQGEFSFFKRIWSAMSSRQQNAFAEVYAQFSGHSMLELLEEIEAKEGSADEFRFSASTENEDFELDDDLDFENLKKSGTGSAKSKNESSQSSSALQMEKIKILYRKLVRKLHPDLQQARASVENSETASDWTQKIWERVQKAYLGEDVESLQRLLKLTLLRSNSLDQLTLDEILEARSWLQVDLEELQDKVQALKISPAWGFSTRKDFASLSRQLNKDFLELSNQIRFQIAEVKRELDLLDRLAEFERPVRHF